MVQLLVCKLLAVCAGWILEQHRTAREVCVCVFYMLCVCIAWSSQTHVFLSLRFWISLASICACEVVLTNLLL